MRKNLIPLFILLTGLLGCKVSYDKNIPPAVQYGGGTWDGGAGGGGDPTPGVNLNAKVCLEGAGAIPMSTSLNSSNFLPYVTPYTLVEPWSHYNSADIALNSGTYSLSSPIWVDWVLVEIYSYNQDYNYYSTEVAQSALLHSNGSLYSTSGTQGLYFANLLPGEYYINIKHRNHLDIATQSKISMTAEIDPLVYNVDFTDPLTVLTGSSVTVGGKQCLAAGDINKDNTIDATDLAAINNQVNSILTSAPDLTELNGYFAADVNLNGVIKKDTAESSPDHGLVSNNNGLTAIVHPNAPAPP